MVPYWDTALDNLMKKAGKGEVNLWLEIYSLKKEKEHLSQALHFSVAVSNQGVVDRLLRYKFDIWDETRELALRNGINIPGL
jgi:hypothetical protein